jgi:ABC-type Fe3+ transport system permease subunit
MRRGARKELLGLLALLLLGWLVVYPLVLVLAEAIGGPGRWTLEAVGRFSRERNEWRALAGSLGLSVASAVGAGLVGIPLGFLTSRIAFPGPPDRLHAARAPGRAAAGSLACWPSCSSSAKPVFWRE